MRGEKEVAGDAHVGAIRRVERVRLLGAHVRWQPPGHERGTAWAADAEGAPSINTQGTVGEKVSSGTATPATNNSPPTSASKSTPITNESVMELLKATLRAARDRSEFGDAEAAKAASEDKESSTASSAAKLIEQLGNSSMTQPSSILSSHAASNPDSKIEVRTTALGDFRAKTRQT